MTEVNPFRETSVIKHNGQCTAKQSHYKRSRSWLKVNDSVGRRNIPLRLTLSEDRSQLGRVTLRGKSRVHSATILVHVVNWEQILVTVGRRYADPRHSLCMSQSQKRSRHRIAVIVITHMSVSVHLINHSSRTWRQPSQIPSANQEH
jgi:hypothetical protein